MADVIWSDEASEHLEEIVAHIELSNPSAAHGIGARLFALGNSLSYAPDRGRPTGRFRELVTVRPFILRYAVQGDEVIIISIRHSSRRPLKS